MSNNHMSPQDKRSGLALWFLVLLTFVGLLGIVFFLLLAPPSGSFEKAWIITPIVTPVDMPTIGFNTSGVVKMKAIVRERQADECLTSTQYFIDLSDGTTWKVPGSRLTNRDRPTFDVIYQTIVPFNSPVGDAWFYVYDTYSCGVRDQKIESPKLKFTISPSIRVLH